jgi:hypothetical protein
MGGPTSCRLRGEFLSSWVRLVRGVDPFCLCKLRRVDFRDAGTDGGVSSNAVVALRARAAPCAAVLFFLILVPFFLDPARCASYR